MNEVKHFYKMGDTVTYLMGAEMELSADSVPATVIALTWEDVDVPTYILKIEENGLVIPNVSHDGIDMPPYWWKI